MEWYELAKRMKTTGFLTIAVIALGCFSTGVLAQAPTLSAETATASDGPVGTAAANIIFTNDELRKLLAPIALYPDPLLAQLLPATAYPIDIVMAARWLDKNEAAVKQSDFSGADVQGWDPSVKALVRFPDIIVRLNTDLDATSDLGDAFVNQPDDVAKVIQDLRREAQKAGSLKSTDQQKVVVQQQKNSNNVATDYIVIEPADPGVIYVPTYDPTTVYYEDNSSDFAAGAIGFGVGVAVGIAIDNAWDWGRGWVYPPRWPGYPGYRPGRPAGINNGNINVGNDINIGSGNVRPWRPDAAKYNPGQGTKPGLAMTNRPGVNGRAGADFANRPNAGNRPGEGNGRDGISKGTPGAGNLANKKTAGKPPGAKAASKGGAAKGASSKVAPGKNRPVAKKPTTAKKAAASRPAPQRPANTAFSGSSFGRGASGAMANRGAVSRQSIQRPSGGGRPGGGGHGGGRGGRR